jgi:hypothetical protein
MLPTIDVLTASMGAWDIQRIDWIIDPLAAAAILDLPQPPATSALMEACIQFAWLAWRERGEAGRAFECLKPLNESERDGFLEAAEGFIPARFAGTLADLLTAHSVPVRGGRIARLLVNDRPRLERLLHGEHSPEVAGEALVAAADQGVEPPVVDADEVETSVKLRLAARSDPIGALAQLVAAAGEEGLAVLSEGAMAVIVRAARRDREYTRRFLMDRLTSVEAQALALRDLCYDGVFEAVDRDSWAELFEQARGGWRTAMALAGVAANAGEVDLAVRVVRDCGLEPWAAYAATFPETRRRNLRIGQQDVRLLEAVRAAGHQKTPMRPFPPPLLAEHSMEQLSALWTVKTLPLDELPWWNAWSGGLP